VFAKLAMTEALLAESKEKPAGHLKVTTTHSFGVTWLAPRLNQFLGAHPDVTLSLLLDDTDLDLAMREADVAIRMHPPRQPDLVQRHLGEIRSQIWAAPSYLQAHGMPATVEDLDNHKIILFGDRRPPVVDVNWLSEIGRKDGTPRQSVLSVNSLQAMLVCIRAGIGIGAVPDYLVQDHTGLVAVLPDVKKPPTDMYFVYPEELRNSKRVSVFRDFLVNSIAERRVVQNAN
jgi:DNA-binding transcriptional LysR family regulator